jgi:acyl-CoA synthetase (AMP-forming)/AMP-acid ligase II
MRDAARMTIVDCLQDCAAAWPTKVAYTFLPSGERDGAIELTFADVDRRARAIAEWLTDAVRIGDRVLLLCTRASDFVPAFFGCLYAGVVPVSAYPLDAARLSRTLGRLETIARDAGAAVGLTTPDAIPRLDEVDGYPSVRQLRWVDIDRIGDRPIGHRGPLTARGDALAFLQYTSGSVRDPRGVMVTHDVLMANLRMLQSTYELHDAITFVAWLPVAHDWGLVNGVIQPAYLGASSVIIPTSAFLERPARWLEAVSEYGDVMSGGPNFAYELCVAKVSERERAALRLGAWGRAGIAAEPIRRSTIDRFASTFERCGFRRSAFYAAYGLAEAMLLVSASDLRSGPATLTVNRDAMRHHDIVVEAAGAPSASEVVSCGRPAPGADVVIVDPIGRVREPQERVGEIWVRGPNIAVGYWNNAEETRLTFGARLSDTGDGPFLRTGDLGFLHAGELFVTGRLKDVVILRGRNIYPQDLEFAAVQSHRALRRGGTAAFAVPASDHDEVVIVQELRAAAGRSADVFTAIRRAVLSEHHVLVNRVVLVEAGAIPKTSSGKLQRSECRRMYLAGRLPVVDESRVGDDPDRRRAVAFQAPRTATERTLIELLAEVVHVDTLGVFDEFVNVCDSVTATQLIVRVRATFGVDLSLAALLGDVSSVALLAQLIDRESPPCVHTIRCQAVYRKDV